MADITVLARLLNGAMRNVDLSSNTPVVLSIKVGGGVTNTELTKAILDSLISNSHAPGSDNQDVVAGAGLTGGGTGATTTLNVGAGDGISVAADSVAVDSSVIRTTGANAFAADQSMGSHKLTNLANGTAATDAVNKQQLDAAVAAGGQVKVSATDTTSGYLYDTIIASSTISKTIVNPGADEQITFDVLPGGISHSNLANLSADDHTQYIRVDGARAFSADQSLGGFKLTNVADPISSQDAVTLAYMNARLNGLTPKMPVRAATTADITLSGTQTIDGVAVVAGNRVLVKNQTAAADNGIYVVVAGAWSRSTDMDSLTPFDEINGAWTAVQEGTQAGQVFVQYGTVATIGTDPLNWSFYNPIAGLIGGDMITFAGSTFSVDLASTSGLESTNPGNSAGQLRVKLEASNPSLKITGSNELAAKLDAAGAIASAASGLAVQVDNSTVEINTNALRVKDAGITLAKLATDSVDENKIKASSFDPAGAVTGGGASKIAVQVDNSTVEINANALRVKDLGITTAKIAAAAVDENKLAASVAGNGLTGGAGAPLAVGTSDNTITVTADAISVNSSPRLAAQIPAGETFSGTLMAVRYGRATDAGFVAGRVYKADNNAASIDNFYVIGLTTASASAGTNMAVIKAGVISTGAHDLTVGEPVFLDTAGALTQTPPSAVNTAVVRVGIVRDATSIDVQIQVVGVN